MARLGACTVALLCLTCCIGWQSVQGYMTEAQMKQAMKTLRNMCLPKSGASKDAINSMHEGVFDPNDKKSKCYLSCILGMMQCIKNNKINLGMIKSQINKMLPPEQGNKIVATFESCGEATGEDQCDLAFNFAKCVYDTDKEVGFRSPVSATTK